MTEQSSPSLLHPNHDADYHRQLFQERLRDALRLAKTVELTPTLRSARQCPPMLQRVVRSVVNEVKKRIAAEKLTSGGTSAIQQQGAHAASSTGQDLQRVRVVDTDVVEWLRWEAEVGRRRDQASLSMTNDGKDTRMMPPKKKTLKSLVKATVVSKKVTDKGKISSLSDVVAAAGQKEERESRRHAKFQPLLFDVGFQLDGDRVLGLRQLWDNCEEASSAVRGALMAVEKMEWLANRREQRAEESRIRKEELRLARLERKRAVYEKNLGLRASDSEGSQEEDDDDFESSEYYEEEEEEEGENTNEAEAAAEDEAAWNELAAAQPKPNPMGRVCGVKPVFVEDDDIARRHTYTDPVSVATAHFFSTHPDILEMLHVVDHRDADVAAVAKRAHETGQTDENGEEPDDNNDNEAFQSAALDSLTTGALVFASALAVIAETQRLDVLCFPPKSHKDLPVGVVTVKLCVDGWWKAVVVDRWLPNWVPQPGPKAAGEDREQLVGESHDAIDEAARPLGAKKSVSLKVKKADAAPSVYDAAMRLIEKGYAKSLGGYAAIIDPYRQEADAAGPNLIQRTITVLHDFAGAPVWSMRDFGAWQDLKAVANQPGGAYSLEFRQSTKESFKVVKGLLQDGCAVSLSSASSCAPSGPVRGTQEFEFFINRHKSAGLPVDSLFNIVRMIETDGNLLCLIRDPLWGTGAHDVHWGGEWCDRSPKWENSVVALAADFEPAQDEGLFWMSWEEVGRWFDDGVVLNLPMAATPHVRIAGTYPLPRLTAAPDLATVLAVGSDTSIAGGEVEVWIGFQLPDSRRGIRSVVVPRQGGVEDEVVSHTINIYAMPGDATSNRSATLVHQVSGVSSSCSPHYFSLSMRPGDNYFVIPQLVDPTMDPETPIEGPTTPSGNSTSGALPSFVLSVFPPSGVKLTVQFRTWTSCAAWTHADMRLGIERRINDGFGAPPGEEFDCRDWLQRTAATYQLCRGLGEFPVCRVGDAVDWS